jgi:hypothetical protein
MVSVVLVSVGCEARAVVVRAGLVDAFFFVVVALFVTAIKRIIT